jgi:hypothetical protein
VIQQSSSGSHKNLAIANLDFKSRNGFDRWHTERTPSSQVEPSTMTGTGNRTLIHRPIRQRLSIMRTNILDCKELVPNPDQQRRKIVDEDRETPAGRNVAQGRNSFKFWHEKGSILADKLR